MRAPRKVKLTKPRPLKSTWSDENGNDSIEVNGHVQENFESMDTDVTEKITALIEKLKVGALSVNDCLQLRDLLAVHCPHLEKINKDYIDTCFKHITDVLKEKTVDKLVLISLQDLTALRQRAWQPISKPSSIRRKSITWNEIAEEIPYKEVNDKKLQIAHKQMSMDSGLGEDDQILWDSEESFKEDLTAEVWSKFNKTLEEKDVKERSPSPLSVVEAVKGLRIVGEDEQFVKVAAELLNKYLNKELITDEENKKLMCSGIKEEIRNNVIRQPLGPGSKNEIVAEVERTLPGGMHSAKGRRAMFRNYSSAMSGQKNDVNDSMFIPKPYGREELLYLSLSPLSRKCPSELSYLSKVFPEACFTEVEQYFHKDDLLMKDLNWNCPVRCTNDQQKSYKRGFSCPDLDTDSNSSRNGFDHRPPTINRVFSCPTGSLHDGHASLQCDSNLDYIIGCRSGFGIQGSTSFGSKTLGSNCYGRQSVDGFGSPSKNLVEENQGSTYRKQDCGVSENYQRNGFGSPN